MSSKLLVSNLGETDQEIQKHSLYELQHDGFGHHIDHGSPCNVEVRIDEQF